VSGGGFKPKTGLVEPELWDHMVPRIPPLIFPGVKRPLKPPLNEGRLRTGEEDVLAAVEAARSRYKIDGQRYQMGCR
jgi:hypothetical protein